ncbi:MAG: N(4)-(beta-N-acetylglucosaminyl)-L-asparaginase [Saprospiraceae bacterium]|nr:N(4)-(beta-N-acetylglucosaminyl)-L-asparaginase [Saprospiraceae bacterium]
MKKSRRRFLQNSLVLVPALGCAPLSYLNGEAKKPLVLSTWDSGVIANAGAWPVLQSEGRALDAVEQGGIAIEDHISCCVGLGGNPDRDGFVTLDACIMDEKANCGSVAFLERIKHPVSVARKVMEETPHVMLVGEGAQQFALEQGFPLEDGKLSPDAEKAYKKWLEKSAYKPVKNIERTQLNKGKGPYAPSMFDDGSFNHDTMGTICIDSHGDLSGMCTTSGMGFKMRGRVGDSPIIGSGLFVDNEAGAAVATGQGEEIIRISGCHLVVELMRNGATPQDACEKAIARIVKRDPVKAKDFQACFIAINKKGEHGAFAVHPGFNYTISDMTQENKVLDSKSYFS